MNIKTKGLFKVLVIALSMLFAVALAFGISGAWYNTTREAKGTLSMAKGIVIDYSGFNQGADVWEDNASFNLFASQNGMLPGQSVELYNTKIKANASSIDFYARAKLEYKFFTDVEGLTEVTSQIADYSAFINTPTFAQGWVDGRNGDGWFYYATGTTFNTIPSSDYVDIFAENQSLTLNIDAPGFNHQGGGYQYSNEILIKRITVTLTLNALQANTAAAEFNGWEISPLVENSNSQVVEILQNTITLGNAGGAYKLGTGEAGSLAYDTATLGTTLKIAVAGDSQINANAFENSGLEEIYIGDQDYINGVSSYAAKIYSSPATFIIGANAFAGCTNLQLHLASGVNYTIYTNAVPSTATVYYNGNQISLPSVSGAVDNTTITMETPSIVTPSPVTGGSSGAGAVNPSNNTSKGEYTYEDVSGNIWYFDLGAYTINYDDWAVNNTNGVEAQLRHVYLASSSSGQTLTIPSSVTSSELLGNIQVVYIGGYSWFVSSEANGDHKKLISSVIIPNSVKCIGDGVFSDFSEMTSASIPSSVLSIQGNAFYNCSKLTSITIPSTIVNLDYTAFLGCQGLTLITGGNSNYWVSDDNKLLVDKTRDGLLIAVAAAGLSGDYIVPNEVKHLYATFQGAGITSITLPDSVHVISENCFIYCSSLSSVVFGNSVTSIFNAAFNGCTSLTSITIPSTVESIEPSAFAYSGLQSVTFEGSGRTQNLDIGSSAFNGCSNLATVNFDNWPSGITVEVGSNAFANCKDGLVVNIPNQD